jgi:hypothetical protein
MRARHDESETHHLMCMVCGALPGTTCIDSDFRELPQVYPSRRMPISERNWRSRQGWQPPELVQQQRNADQTASCAGCTVQRAPWLGG